MVDTGGINKGAIMKEVLNGVVSGLVSGLVSVIGMIVVEVLK